jgi:hypothetical protein
MTEPERDERIVQAYRSLGGEEPPPGLDAAILAASRRRGLRWQAPFAAAAALVLAVAVALVLEREETEKREEVALAPQVMKAPAPAPAPAAPQTAAPAAPAAKVQSRVAQAPEPKDERALAERQEIARAPAAPVAGRRAAEPAEDRVAAVAGALRSDAAGKPETPERWLERIAKLREAGRDKEADESLAEFRRRYPDFRIPQEMRARVLAR